MFPIASYTLSYRLFFNILLVIYIFFYYSILSRQLWHSRQCCQIEAHRVADNWVADDYVRIPFLRPNKFFSITLYIL
jgi:hypothetical protein